MEDKRIVSDFVSSLLRYDGIDRMDLSNYVVSLLFYFYFQDYNYENQDFGITVSKRVDPKKIDFTYNQIDEFLKGVKYENEQAKLFYKDIFNYLDKRYLEEQKVNELRRVIYRYNDYPKVYEYLLEYKTAYGLGNVKEYVSSQNINNLISELAIHTGGNYDTIYNPTIGSGLLVSEVVKKGVIKNVYAQDVSPNAGLMAKVSLLINGLSYKGINVKVDDIIKNPHFTDQEFGLIISQPPMGLVWNPEAFLLKDNRFKDFPVLPPKRAADYAFIQHMLYFLKDSGMMIIAMGHGMLFRGGAEKVIRTELIKNNYLEAVIGLPEALNYSTRIPTVILIFRQNKQNDKVLFINAEDDYKHSRPINILRNKDIRKIVETYKNKDVINKYSYYASLKEIKDNDYNLNISRYVNTFEKEDLFSLKYIDEQLRNIEQELKLVEEEIKKLS